MAEQLDDKKTPKKGIYLLPNIITLAGMFAGFYSIIASMKGYYDTAAWVIFVGMVFDSMDGRVARLTNTQSEFGAQLDSLADLVTFGIAPAILLYTWGLIHLGKIGWLCAFCYAACGALRLARFNAMIDQVDSSYFQGFPIPAGAGMVTGLVWAVSSYGISGNAASVWVGFATVITAILMVSNISYYSFKTFDFKGRVPFANIVIMLFIIIGIAIKPDQVLFYSFLIYGISGPLWWVKQLFNRKKKVVESVS